MTMRDALINDGFSVKNVSIVFNKTKLNRNFILTTSRAGGKTTYAMLTIILQVMDKNIDDIYICSRCVNIGTKRRLILKCRDNKNSKDKTIILCNYLNILGIEYTRHTEFHIKL